MEFVLVKFDHVKGNKNFNILRPSVDFVSFTVITMGKLSFPGCP